MTKGKPWPTGDEKLLRDWFSSGITDLTILFSKFGEKYSEEGIRQKLISNGLLNEQRRRRHAKREFFCSPKLDLPTNLPTVEDTLKILAATMHKSIEGGLSKEEIQHLQVVANLATAYKAALAEYMDYRGLEKRLEEAEAKYAEITRKTTA
jgi:hypothetical protein